MGSMAEVSAAMKQLFTDIMRMNLEHAKEVEPVKNANTMAKDKI